MDHYSPNSKLGRMSMLSSTLGVQTRVLDFFHIDVKPGEDKFKLWTKFDKCGIFTIEMARWSTRISWRICLIRIGIGSWNKCMNIGSLVRLPPNKRVESFVINRVSYFYQQEGVVMASLRIWNGRIAISSLRE